MWILLGIIAYILFFLTIVLKFTVRYLTTVISIDSFSQVLYTLQSGTDGVGATLWEAVGDFFKSEGIWLLLGLMVLAFYIFVCLLRRKDGPFKHALVEKIRAQALRPVVFRCSSAVVALAVCTALSVQLFNGWQVLGIGDYLVSSSQYTALYDDYFVQPGDVEITFPAEKKNVIHLVLESMETTFTGKENGGGYENSLIPNLTKLALEEGECFNAEDQPDIINGAKVTKNAYWTVAGLVAETAGLNLNIGHNNFRGNFDENTEFLPNITSLGDILKEEGYKNYFMCGSEGVYAGRQNYFEQHGDYEVYDLHWARKEGLIPDDYHVWWGYEDEKLFDYAKTELTRISQNEEPFNFTFLTCDTHYAEGYHCADCPDEHELQYENVYTCSDKRIYEFINWVREQDFYEDTVIILSGDHCTMAAVESMNMDPEYDRRAFFTVLNGPKAARSEARLYTTVDIFPTIVEAMGASIEGHRLGLGTSLYSLVPTLSESLGFEFLNEEIAKQSEYYEKVILQGDHSGIIPQEPAQEKDDEEKVELEIAAVEPAAEPSTPSSTWTWQDELEYQPQPPVYTPQTPAAQQPQQPAVPVVPEEPVNPEPEPEPVVPDTPQPPITPDPEPVVPEPIINPDPAPDLPVVETGE